MRYLRLKQCISRTVYVFFITLAGAGVLTVRGEGNTQKSSSQWPFITRRGDKLYEGDKVFRFFGLAAPNIQQNESQIRADRTNRFPDEYEIVDILDGIKRTGGKVTRTFSLSVFHPDDKGMPVYIPGRRTYNEDAFRCLDMMLVKLHEYHMRAIIPFIASQSFAGIRGVDEFAALAKKPGAEFWTDEDIKADFRHFLDFILNRKNTISGILYKDDPAILAWQLGNEFGSYAGDRKLSYDTWTPVITRWSQEFAAYIKKVDPNHLVMEAGGGDRKVFLDDPNIDIISDHYYEYWSRLGGGDGMLAPMAKRARQECRGIKPLIIDEFGLGSVENIRQLMTTIREDGISGGLLWAIRGHRRDGGWYYHNEGGTPINSFHVPGSAAGFAYDETRMLDILRKETYKIRGINPELPEIPYPAPVLFRKGEGFTWRGSAGATSYTIERSESQDGQWSVIATGLNDAVIFDVKSFEPSAEASEPLTLYYDENAEAGKIYYYRIKAINKAGETAYSGNVKVDPGK